MLELPPPFLPVRPWSRVFPEAVALRLDFFPHNPQQIRPLLGLCEAHLPEVDDVSVISMSRAVVHLFTADIREDSVGVPLILLYQVAHDRERIGTALDLGVVKREPLPVDLRAEKGLVRVLLQRRRILVTPRVKKEGG